jgi:hypothetical protein
LEAGAAKNRAMLNGMNFFDLGTCAANHAGITHAQMLAADDQDGTIYTRNPPAPLEPTALALY